MSYEMDYVDKINYSADKVAAANLNPMAGAMARYNMISEDVPGAVAALFEKTAAMQEVLVKLANVVETLTENAADLIAANQGNADATVQGGEGTDESTNEGLKKKQTVESGALDNGIMQDAKNGGDITSKQYADAGVGVSKNKKETTGDIIAAAKQRSGRVQSILRDIASRK